MAILEEEFSTLRSMKGRQWCRSLSGFLALICSALMVWKILVVCTGSESPIVVVLSGSMEPGYYRGDMLFLTLLSSDEIAVGDISVYKLDGRDIPIVHRILRLHERNNVTSSCHKKMNEATTESGQREEEGRAGRTGEKTIEDCSDSQLTRDATPGDTYILTKGDNNPHDDRMLYDNGKSFIKQHNLMGRSRAYLPFVGFLTIMVAENWWLKIVVISTLFFFMIAGKEEGF